MSRSYKHKNLILSRINDLLLFENLGVLIDENARKLLVHKNYYIYYEIVDDSIIILGIKNTKLNIFY